MPAKRIYIIDDNELVRESLATLIDLQPDMETCGEASNARAAQAEIPDLAPDLVLVDLKLNDKIGGLQLLAQLHEEHPDLPTIAITGHADGDYREPALKAGARRFIDKKDAVSTLVSTIRDVLQGA